MNFNTVFKFRDIEYFIIKGNNIIFLIKPGLDGSIFGYHNKYLNLANYINNKYGYTVVCTNNPIESKKDQIEDAICIIKQYCIEMNFINYEVYYYGNSNGGYQGSIYGYKYPKIKKMILINPPLMININKIVDGSNNFNGEKIVFVFGEYDQSIKYISILDLVKNEKMKYYVIEGENHNLSNNKCTLEKLVDDYLLQ